MPLIHEGRLYLFYSAEPTIVLEPDPESGGCRVVSQQFPTANLDRYRGSSQFIPFNGRLLGVMHEVITQNENPTYLHRFVILNPETWEITHATHPFTFLHSGVEYCCGLTWAHEPTEILLSFSFEDRESWIARVDREQVRSMLVPIEHLTVLSPLSKGPQESDIPATENHDDLPWHSRVLRMPRLQRS